MEEIKELQMAREFPSLEERRNMILTKANINEIKMLTSPPQVVKETTLMFFVLIDSFGMEMHPKLR